MKESVDANSDGNFLYGRPVDPRSALAAITGNRPPGHVQVAGIGHPIPQVAVWFFGVFPTPLVELSLNAEEPSLWGLITRVHW
jgi:hypothetical protein